MTINELLTLIDETVWFNHLTESDVEKEYARIPSLAPWASEGIFDAEHERIADQMEWLPSSREQDDPIHGRNLEQRAEAQGKKEEFSAVSMEIYKATLGSLRKYVGNSALKVGPHDFTEAARGAALYAARRASYEILLNEPGFWCGLM